MRKMENDRKMDALGKPNWGDLSGMRSFDKNFYSESEAQRRRTNDETAHFLRTHSVTVSGSQFVRPVESFYDLNLPSVLANKIKDMKFEKPTPIQSLCWPTLLSGINMVGIAQTGSGKTMGFLLPIVMHIMNNQRYLRSFDRDDLPGPVALVLAPTRELALQIQQVANTLGNTLGIRNAVIYGGSPKGPQLGEVRRGAEIYIATPGRLIDFVRERDISLSRCTFLVLDEADRMLDMGFEPQIRKIIEQIRPDRQTAMFSATWPKEVRRLAEDFISNNVLIQIGAQELRANPNIRQIVEVCQESDKQRRLREILSEIMRQRDRKSVV